MLVFVLGSEKVLCDKGERGPEVPGDPDVPAGGSEDHFVPPGDGGARRRLCLGWSHGEELRSHSGVGAGLGPVQPGSGPDQQGAGFCGTKPKLVHKSIMSHHADTPACCSSGLLFVPWAARRGQVWRICFVIQRFMTELFSKPVLCRVVDVLEQSDPSSVSLDEAKAEQILSLASNMLLLVCSQTPLIRKLLKSCQFDSSPWHQGLDLLTPKWFNFHLQIPVRYIWIRRRLTQNWWSPPGGTVWPTPTPGSRSLMFPSASTPRWMSSVCKASALAAITGRSMWLGKPTGSLASPTPPFHAKVHRRTAGWAGGPSPGVWSSLMGSTQPGTEGSLISCRSQRPSVGSACCAASPRGWWRLWKWTEWRLFSPSVQEPSQIAFTWRCVPVTTTTAKTPNPSCFSTAHLPPVISEVWIHWRASRLSCWDRDAKALQQGSAATWGSPTPLQRKI